MKKLKLFIKFLLAKGGIEKSKLLTLLLIEENDSLYKEKVGVKTLTIWWDYDHTKERTIGVDTSPNVERFKIKTNIKNENYAGDN